MSAWRRFCACIVNSSSASVLPSTGGNVLVVVAASGALVASAAVGVSASALGRVKTPQALTLAP